MVRIHVQLTDAQAESLRQLSKVQQVSIAQMIQASVDDYLNLQLGAPRGAIAQRALEVVGKFSCPETDISTNHDEYLAEFAIG